MRSWSFSAYVRTFRRRTTTAAATNVSQIVQPEGALIARQSWTKNATHEDRGREEVVPGIPPAVGLEVLRGRLGHAFLSVQSVTVPGPDTR